MNEAWKNGKKNLILGLILVCLPQSQAQIFFFCNFTLTSS